MLDAETVEDCPFAESRAKAFVLRHMAPANRATEEAVEALRFGLGCQRRAGHKRAICGFLQACQVLSDANTKTLAFPSAKAVYVDDGGSYQAFMRVSATSKPAASDVAHPEKSIIKPIKPIGERPSVSLTTRAFS